MKLVLLFVSLTCLVGICLGCSCEPKLDNKERYCAADFIIDVEVTSDYINQNGAFEDKEDYHKIKILKKHKWKKDKMKTVKPGKFKRRLYTPHDDAHCGIVLNKGDKVTISGKVIDKRMHVHWCYTFSYATPVPSTIQSMIDNPPIFPNFQGPTDVKVAG